MELASDATIKLLVVDQDSKRFDTTQSDLRIGDVRLHGRQVHPVRVRPGHFSGQDAYLVKLNYELATTPDTPAMNWFEFGVELRAGAVLDAVPHHTSPSQQAQSYVVNDHLNLVPSTSDTAHAHVPSAGEAIHAFGVGSNGARWQHVSASDAGVRPGSRVAWLVVLVERGVTHLDVTATARFDLNPVPDWNVLPGHEPLELRIELRDPVTARPEITAALTADEGTALRLIGPRVFISYTHDDEEHKQQVRRLANLLVACGLDVRFDQFEGPRRRDWFTWAIGNIDNADFVIIVASPKCRAVGDGTIGKNEHRGMHCELGVIRDRLIEDRETWEQKLLPTVLPGEVVSNLPVFLQPRAMDHYQLDELTEEEVGKLLAPIHAGIERSNSPIVLTATTTGQALAPKES